MSICVHGGTAWSKQNISSALRVFEEFLQRGDDRQRTVLLIVSSCGPDTVAIMAFRGERGLGEIVCLVEKVN